MISLGVQRLNAGVESLISLSQDIKPQPVLFYPYLKRVLTQEAKTCTPTYPIDIKIPKDNKFLLKGDFEPAYTIHLDKPVMLDSETPMWFNTTSKAIHLRFGYENLDARVISKQVFDNAIIHGFLGGSSGQGKSVTLNSLLGGLFYEYAPWELEVHLSDAKIVEFKKYGIGHRIPHIASIAATEDADFVISVLQNAVQRLNERNKFFPLAHASDLKEFRKNTGLALPRILIVMDEFESTCRLAGRRSALIGKLVEDVARLGRSAGCHILMATQNLTADIPKTALGQIALRCCLGATETVSQGVLANNAATQNYGHKGRLIVNTHVINGGDTTPYNIKFQTPFINDTEFEGEMKTLEDLGSKVGYRAHMNFYDEGDIKTVEQFDSIVDNVFSRMSSSGEITPTHLPIVLGMPSFVTKDADGLLKIWLERKDLENILITSTSTEHIMAHIHNISKSLDKCGYLNQLFTTDKDVVPWVFNPLASQEVSTAEKAPLSTVGSLVRKRLCLLEMDTLASHASFDRAQVENIFQESKIPRESWGNDLLARRLVAYLKMFDKSNKEWDDIRYLFPTFLEVFEEFQKVNALVNAIDPKNFQKATFIIGDLSKIIGYGRDTKEVYVQSLKKVMQDAHRVGVLFILFTRSMEGITGFVSGLRYVIFDAPDSKEWGRLRTDEPRELSPVLSVLFDNVASKEDAQLKFKRTLLREE